MKKIVIGLFILILLSISLLVEPQGAMALTCVNVTYGEATISQTRDGQTCYYPVDCIEAGDVTIGFDISPTNGSMDSILSNWEIWADNGNLFFIPMSAPQNINPSKHAEATLNLAEGRYSVFAHGVLGFGACESPRVSLQVYANGKCASAGKCTGKKTDAIQSGWDLCLQIPAQEINQRLNCQRCLEGKGMWTAVGCIPTSPESIVRTIISIGLGLSGVVVLFMILLGSFNLSTSQGDPNKAKEAKEMISSAVIGLLFIIFSVTILQFIGVSILHIPGFGE